MKGKGGYMYLKKSEFLKVRKGEIGVKDWRLTAFGCQTHFSTGL